MELLRIVSMLMVLLLHANFLVFGTPTVADATCQPVATFIRLFFESVSIVGVNLFVFISGWYGIKAKLRRIAASCFRYSFLLLSAMGRKLWFWAQTPSRSPIFSIC
ncbi:hypothetical protein [Prevotella corporis]|uniref:hypothetical protein n=1 Tax=Prevotella corporis TaxID=28128 RepID=UPI0012DEEFED|nr:hypothetical protein [Prevotella corporis]